MMCVMVIYSHDVLEEVLENRITNYLMTLVFLPSCDNIPIAQNKMRNCRRKYDFIMSLDLDAVVGHVLKQVG